MLEYVFLLDPCDITQDLRLLASCISRTSELDVGMPENELGLQLCSAYGSPVVWVDSGKRIDERFPLEMDSRRSDVVFESHIPPNPATITIEPCDKSRRYTFSYPALICLSVQPPSFRPWAGSRRCPNIHTHVVIHQETPLRDTAYSVLSIRRFRHLRLVRA